MEVSAGGARCSSDVGVGANGPYEHTAKPKPEQNPVFQPGDRLQEERPLLKLSSADNTIGKLLNQEIAIIDPSVRAPTL